MKPQQLLCSIHADLVAKTTLSSKHFWLNRTIGIGVQVAWIHATLVIKGWQSHLPHHWLEELKVLMPDDVEAGIRLDKLLQCLFVILKGQMGKSNRLDTLAFEHIRWRSPIWGGSHFHGIDLTSKSNNRFNLWLSTCFILPETELLCPLIWVERMSDWIVARVKDVLNGLQHLLHVSIWNGKYKRVWKTMSLSKLTW